MSINDSYLKTIGSNDVTVPAFNDLTHARRENLYSSSTIHVNPLCASNKILVNKEKLSKGTRSKAPLQATSERIYYNPKFLTKDVKTSADIYIKSCNEFNSCQGDLIKTADSKIHINRNYLTSQNDANAAIAFRYLCDNAQINCREHSHGIHINPKFLKNQCQLDKFNASEVPTRLAPIQSTNKPSIKYVSPAKRKELKNIITLSNKNSNIKSGIQSKYKFVKNSSHQSKIENTPSSLCYKTKYSFKRLIIGKDNCKLSNKINEVPKVKPHINSKIKFVRLTSEFKKLSRTKLVRKSVLQSLILARRCSRNNLYKRTLSDLSSYKKIPLKKKTSNIMYFPKGNQISKHRSTSVSNYNSFKRLSKMKIVRKSLLKAQIESRNQVRKYYWRDQRILKYRRKNYSIRTDSLRKNYVAKQRDLLSWRKKKQVCDPAQTKGKKTSHTPSLKSLRKNNHPCPFYNRFGRCKGKDKGTCSKLHDAKYISICRKFLQNECDAKDCLLSHDIRPGKMPTCHHYLAGLCTRPNCPFLHIKVNPKAPICMAFLQGFCPDVFNCLKRHEFICPIYAEKGTCPRGKSCTYPHRSPVVHSKLLKDDQKPLIHRKDILVNSSCESKFKQEVSSIPKTSLGYDNEKNEEKIPVNVKNKKYKKEFIKESFTRYFAVPSNTEDISKADGSKPKESNELHENIVDEFR